MPRLENYVSYAGELLQRKKTKYTPVLERVTRNKLEEEDCNPTTEPIVLDVGETSAVICPPQVANAKLQVWTKATPVKGSDLYTVAIITESESPAISRHHRKDRKIFPLEGENGAAIPEEEAISIMSVANAILKHLHHFDALEPAPFRRRQATLDPIEIVAAQ